MLFVYQHLQFHELFIIKVVFENQFYVRFKKKRT